VNRVHSGLGHGLDEARSGSSTNKIQTCETDGQPVISLRVVRMSFDWLTEFLLRGEQRNGAS